MNHTQLITIKHNDLVLEFKPTHRSLYNTLKMPVLDNKMALLVNELTQMNLEVVYSFLANMSTKDMTLDELLDLDIPLDTVAGAVAEAVAMISGERKEKKT